MDYNPEIWFPHYWFVLQTISMTYPIKPNEECKKKYYDLIQDIKDMKWFYTKKKIIFLIIISLLICFIMYYY